MSEKDFDKGYKSGFKFGKEVMLDKVKQAREEIESLTPWDESLVEMYEVLAILDKLIESEEK